MRKHDVLLLAGAVAATATPGLAQQIAITRCVFGDAVRVSGGGFAIRGVCGQAVTGPVAAAPFRVNAGFFAGFDSVGSPCSTADVAEPFGDVDINDILEFAAAFDAGRPLADVSPPGAPDGAIDINDILEFAAVFDLGCP